MDNHGQFWRHLLNVRREVTWGNFFWFSPKTLLMSLNDQIAKSIEEVDENGSIVDRRRMRWMAEQRQRADWPGVTQPIRIPDSPGFLALGDPGEMDASQYVLVRDLWLHEAALRRSGVKTVLLMSDVVYPAGDINQWADAVYLPYFGRPSRAWSTALDTWQGRVPGVAASTATGTTEDFVAPFRNEWNVLAMPGNHDWYDGLNGFMYNAAGAEPLSEVTYDDSDLTVRQRLAQRLWRNPAAPKRELVQRLRSEVDRGRAPGIPGLPGPYYAVDLGCRLAEEPDHEHRTDGNCPPVMRLVMVDNGITGSVDPEQAAWISRMLSDPESRSLPHIVVTGIPVATRNKFNWLRIAQSDLDLPPTEKDREQPVRELMTLLEGKRNLIATIAGDIHNYQRLELATDLSSKQAAKVGLPPLQIVAGGAGAFLSENHTTKLRSDGGLTLARAHDEILKKPAVRVDIEPEGHLRFPSREGSFLHYARRLPSYTRTMGFLAGLAVLGIVFGTRALYGVGDATSTEPVVSPGWLIAGPWLVAVLAGLELMVHAKPRVPPHSWRRRIKVSGQILVPVGIAVAVVCCGQLSVLLGILVATGLVLFMLTAQALPAVFQYLPNLRRSWVLWGALAVVTVLLARADPTLERPAIFLLSLVIFVVALVLAILFYREFGRRLTRRSILLEPATTNWVRVVSFSIKAFRAVPALLVSAGLFVLFVWEPEAVLDAVGVDQAAYLAQVSRVLFWSTLAVLCVGVCAFAALMPLRKASRAAPASLWWAMGGTALLSFIGGCYLLDWGNPDLSHWRDSFVGCFGSPAAAWRCDVAPTLSLVNIWNVAMLANVLLVAAVAGLLLFLLPAQFNRLQPPSSAAVRRFLRNRDGADMSVAKSRSLLGTVLVGSIPNIESLSEAATPPFAKSVLVVRPHGTSAVDFLAYGLNDESPAKEPRGPLPETPPDDTSAEGPETGFFLLDHVRVDVATRNVERVAHWGSLSSTAP